MPNQSITAFFLTAAMFASPQIAFGAAGDDIQTVNPLKALTPRSDRSERSQSQNPMVLRAHAGVSRGYILGPGDVLSITDVTEDKPQVSLAPILPDGTAVTSYTGVIEAAGKTVTELNELVNDRAKKWYVNPQIMVNLAKQRPTQVYLLGELVHPGYYSAGADSQLMPSASGENNDESSSQNGSQGNSNSSNASISTSPTLTISGALQLAGGLKETADVRHIRVSRQSPKATFPIDLWKLMLDGDVSEDITLQPGDVVYVPKGGNDFDPAMFGRLVNNSPKVRVFGSVKSPGLLNMSPDDDLLSVIAKAGGFDVAAVTKYVVLARTNRDGTVIQEKVNIKRGIKDGHSEARMKIRPGDLIIVKRSPTKTVGVTIGRTLPQLITSGMMSILITRFNTTATASTATTR